MKNMIFKGVFKELGIEIVAIKAVGNYSDFVTENFTVSNGFYNPKTNTYRTYKERYIDMLNKGDCLLYKNYLVFAPGFENNYKECANKYIKGMNNNQLYNDLKDISSYSMVKSFITMCNNGHLSKESTITRLKKYFNNEQLLLNYITV